MARRAIWTRCATGSEASPSRVVPYTNFERSSGGRLGKGAPCIVFPLTQAGSDIQRDLDSMEAARRCVLLLGDSPIHGVEVVFRHAPSTPRARRRYARDESDGKPCRD